ncbi:MAG: response regulator [Gemmatimonadaceae bacterium]|nr:response regulator [Gemmatimonadaceae bacterium]
MSDAADATPVVALPEALTVAPPATAVAVVDDDAALRTSLVRLLREEGHEAEGFASGPDFLAASEKRGFGCAIVDLRMPQMTGLELQRLLVARGDPMPLLFLTAFGTIPESVRAMRDGAVDFLEKPLDTDRMLDAVQRALAIGRGRDAVRQRLADASARVSTLSPREREVMHAVARGLLNKQIAAELGITVRTVKYHRARVMEKTGAGSVPDLVRLLSDTSDAASS